MKRVVVTGLGCITPIGQTVAEFSDALFAGRSGLSTFTAGETGSPWPETGLRFATWGRVRDFDAAQHIPAATLAMTARNTHFGMVSAREAAAESGLAAFYSPDEIAIVSGCSCGGREADEVAARELYVRNARVPPPVILRTMASSGASCIAIDLGLRGPALNLATACASGTHAIGMAYQMVRSGIAPAALAGGFEAPLTLGFLRAWDSMRVVSSGGCRPFSADRDGMTLAEGAAILALEPLESAQARGAHIYAEIVGFGMSTDAHHLTQPNPDGAAAAFTRALEDAASTGIDHPADRVGYINAHGTGTLSNDAAEAEAIRKALGDRAASIPVSSTKGLHGHSIGAAGAIETLATVLALDRGLLPATARTTTVDPRLEIDVICGKPRPMAEGKDLALKSSLAFGGLNAVLALRRFNADSPADQLP